MNKLYNQNDNVSLCHKDNCIHASGRNADYIAAAACVAILFIGFAAFYRAL